MNWHDPSPWIAVATSAALLLGALAALWRVVRSVARHVRDFVHLVDDLRGEAARPGQDARPGILEIQADQTKQLKAIQHEFRPNGGETMRDALNRVDDALNRVERKTEAAAKLASDSSVETRRYIDQHVWHVTKFHGDGEERRHNEPPGEPHA